MSLPGKVALKIEPNILRKLTCRHQVIIVSGTNGKTTTAHLIAAVLERNARVCLNATGANLLSGIVAALTVRVPSPQTWIVLEVDEACAPKVVEQCSPQALVLTNVSRDQLDRFSEIDATAERLKAALHALPCSASAVVNGDDPYLVAAARNAACWIKTYSAAGVLGVTPSAWNVDAARCPICRTELDNSGGGFQCARCGLASPLNALTFERVDGVTPLRARLNGMPVHSKLAGIPGAYNTLAAVATCETLGIPMTQIASAIARFQPPFGRGGVDSIADTATIVMLSKNPASFSINIERLAHVGEPACVIVAVNDREADGQDVSWLWDVPFERLGISHLRVIASGSRAADVGLRLQYANVSFSCVPETLRAIREAGSVHHTLPIYLMCTYTVVLDLFRSGVIRSVA